jgi:hypothetical protein
VVGGGREKEILSNLRNGSDINVQGFETGMWVGQWKNENQQGETAMDVTMVAGVVAGYGTDVVCALKSKIRIRNRTCETRKTRKTRILLYFGLNISQFLPSSSENRTKLNCVRKF